MPSPSRKIKPTRRSVSGHYPFRNAAMIAYESTLERDFIILQESNVKVSGIVSQPVTIPFVLNGRTYRYTPDFLVFFRGNVPNGILVEVKPEEEWRTHWRSWLTKWKAAYRWAYERGYRFHIYDEKRIRGQNLQNIRALQSFKNTALNPADIETACRLILQAGGMTVSDFLLCFPRSPAESTRLLWQLLSRGILETDLNLPLDNYSFLTISLHYVEKNHGG